MNMNGLCRCCGATLRRSFCDLGMSPLSNAYLSADQTRRMERFYPLHAHVCESCFLVQLGEFESPGEIFRDYAYFSSFSESWLQHARDYVNRMVVERSLGSEAKVIEIASNDGYLLQYFVQRGIPVLGIEPAANVARVAIERGIPTEIDFFGSVLAARLVERGRPADLVIGNNVLAHVPALNDFVAGLAIVVKPRGLITMEFPHLMQLIRHNQFDTIYHEHFSYFSLYTVSSLFAAHDLRIFDVEELPTHGGSLRIYAARASSAPEVTTRLRDLLRREVEFGLSQVETFDRFDDRVKATKRQLLHFLLRAKDGGKRIVAYGAAAKGNTLLNYCGIRSDIIDYVVDRSSHKQGRFLPGTHLPILDPSRIFETRPDHVLILPWNLKNEIVSQMSGIRAWGGTFVVPIPSVEVIE